MPHSSGGGSSHGGSHGSSRSNKPANMRYGNRYYSGANRYVYYRNNAPYYYYSEKPYTLQTAKAERIRSIISSIISAIIGIYFAFTGFLSLPQKVKLDYNTEIIINDSAHLLTGTDERDMEDAFLAFQNKTGVTPSFFTITDAELKHSGSSLHNYAYKLYVNTFEDEKHWLVVYCSNNEDHSWSWEGMIGDNCDSIITADMENDFTDRLQKNLLSNSKNLSAAVIDAFEKTGSKTGGFPREKITTLLFCFVGGGLLIFTAVKGVIGGIKNNPADDPRLNAVECPTAEKEPETAKCEYCGGEFVVGLHTTCPHCGASIENWE